MRDHGLQRRDHHVLADGLAHDVEGRQTFAVEVKKHVLPTWGSMIVIGESRYKIGSSNEEANGAWERIKAKFFDAPAQAAA